VDGKGQSSPISGLRVSSIDLKTDTGPSGGARSRKFDISLQALRAASIRVGNVGHASAEPIRETGGESRQPFSRSKRAVSSNPRTHPERPARMAGTSVCSVPLFLKRGVDSSTPTAAIDPLARSWMGSTHSAILGDLTVVVLCSEPPWG